MSMYLAASQSGSRLDCQSVRLVSKTSWANGQISV